MPIRTYRRKLEVFEHVESLRGVFQLIEIPVDKPDLQARKSTRQCFEVSTKDIFFKWLAVKHPDRLKAHGFDDYDVALIAAKGYNAYLSLRSEYLNQWNLDHIVPIQNTGKSIPLNISIIPTWINLLKDQYQEAQLQRGLGEGKLLTLAPPNIGNVFDPFPSIPQHLLQRPH